MTNRKRDSALAASLMLSPWVMAMRLPVMAREAGTLGRTGAETIRAASEKSAALAEGMAAAQVTMASAMLSFWPEVLSGRVPALLSGAAAENSVRAALKPAGRRVRANYRRLSSR